MKFSILGLKHCVQKIFLLTNAPKYRLAHENHCIKRPSQLRQFHSYQFGLFPLVNALVYADID